MSAKFDEIDDIYFERDPIGASLLQRKKIGGLPTCVSKTLQTKNGKFFFTLKVKKPALSEFMR